MIAPPGGVPPAVVELADVKRRLANLEAVRGKIGEGTIKGGATGHIEHGGITEELINVLAINAGHLQANSVATINLQADSVKAGKIDALAVNTRELAADAVTAVKLAS